MRLRKYLFFLTLLTAHAHAVKVNSYQPLFNGVNLQGWKHVGSGNFRVKDHLLVTQGGMGLLYYEKQKFTNVEVKIVYKTSYPGSNSGIFVRIGDKPKDAWDAVNHGYEVQICDRGPDAFDDRHRTGAVYSFTAARDHAELPPGQWNTMLIKLKEEFIKVSLNGKLVSVYAPNMKVPPRERDSDPERGPRAIAGYIGLQNHDHSSSYPNDHVYFKEISVKSLD